MAGLQVWSTVDLKDDDSPILTSCISTEDCGVLTFSPTQQAGTFSTNGGGLSINYTVMEVPANTVTSTDTIICWNNCLLGITIFISSLIGFVEISF